MAKILICYHSRTHHTEHMAEAVAAGAKQVQEAQVDLKSASQVKAADWLNYDARHTDITATLFLPETRSAPYNIATNWHDTVIGLAGGCDARDRPDDFALQDPRKTRRRWDG